MLLANLLLIAIVWLLWTIHQDLLESNQRQRNIRMELIKMAESPEKIVAEAIVSDAASIERIGLNSASKSTLRTLPQVGAATADRIIAARPISSVEDLMKLDGINDKVLEKIRGQVTTD